MDKSMREIEVSQITDIVEKLCIAANEHLPEDVKCAIRSCRACEDGQIAQGIPVSYTHLTLPTSFTV